MGSKHFQKPILYETDVIGMRCANAEQSHYNSFDILTWSCMQLALSIQDLVMKG
jgi:hypothetical protein